MIAMLSMRKSPAFHWPLQGLPEEETKVGDGGDGDWGHLYKVVALGWERGEEGDGGRGY